MTRRNFLLTTSALAQPAIRPNIVVILADDLGWKDVGYHGGPEQTPNIDRLANSGLRLESFYAYPLCSPTRSALLTGRNPIRFGLAYSVVRPWAYYGLPLTEQLLPESFRNAGYQTAIIGKWHLGHSNKKLLPGSRGFDHFYGHVNGAIDYNTHLRDNGIDWQRNGESIREAGYATDLLATEAIRWLNQRDKTKPYFLYLPFNAPHSPLQAPPALIEKYKHIENPRRRTYAAMVDALDQAIGRVTASLDSNTIVFFSSDNGGPKAQGADNGALRAGKATTYEGGIRVPAFINAPGKLKSGTSHQVMAIWDVLPTLAAAAQIRLAPRNPLDGLNLWPQLTGAASSIPRENLFFCTQPETGIKQYALRDGDWKLVRTLSDPPVQELFNIKLDPEEKTPLAAGSSPLVQKLDAWIALHPKGDYFYTSTPHPGWVAPKDWSKTAVD